MPKSSGAQHVDHDGYRLGQWVAVQRGTYRRGELSEERATRLAGLPHWFWHHHREAWEKGYLRLKRFAAREGHALVRKSYTEEDGYRLDLWVLHQRDAYRRGKLSHEQATRLNEIAGWIWDPGEATFAEGLERLLNYARQNGNTLVPNDYVEGDGYKLGLWVANRRGDYRVGRLSNGRINQLGEVPGWTWSQKGDAWERGYKQLCEFIAREHHSRVPRTYQDSDGFRLGSWAHNQRANYASNTLAKDRVDRLDQLDGWKWVSGSELFDELWQDAYEHLCKFVDREGHTRVPRNHVEPDGFKLGQWITVQRNWFKRGKLSNSRASQLEAVSGWYWNSHDVAWEKGYSNLQAFLAREGHVRVPNGHIENGYRLGQWAGVQRTAHRDGKLGASRENRLEDLRGWTWDLRGAQAL